MIDDYMTRQCNLLSLYRTIDGYLTRPGPHDTADDIYRYREDDCAVVLC